MASASASPTGPADVTLLLQVRADEGPAVCSTLAGSRAAEGRAVMVGAQPRLLVDVPGGGQTVLQATASGTVAEKSQEALGNLLGVRIDAVDQGADVEADLVQDGWTKIFRNLTGKVAKQADGAVVVRYGGTMVLATCVGAKGVEVVLARMQQALLEHGYVTSRVMVVPQNLNDGVLTVAFIPGILRAVRWTQESTASTSLRTAWMERPPTTSGSASRRRMPSLPDCTASPTRPRPAPRSCLCIRRSCSRSRTTRGSATRRQW
mgnify:CR=1 FL=1